MASSLNIQEVLLTNTFDEFRLRTNTVIEELNKFGTGSATVIVGSLETSTGLGEDGHLTVNGDLLVTGNATIQGNLTFGNAETDTISFVADIASDVLPDTPYNFSLGSATKQWQDLYLSGTANINIVSATSATVTNDFTVDTTTFHVDSTTNRVGILTATPDVTLDIGDATDAMHIPVGTTAERPGAAAAGYFRYNTSLNQFEGYSNNVWGAIGGGGTNTFTTDIFTGDNVTTDFVLSQATEFDTNLMVFIDGVYQTPNAYDVSTTLGISTLSFSAPPATGRTIVAYVVAAGVSGNNLNQNSFTGDGATVTYALTIPPINKNNTQVFIDGVYQQKDAYSVSGYDLTFTDPPPDQTTIEIMTFTQTEVNVPVDGTIESVHLLGDLVTPGALDVTTDLTVTGTTTLNGNLVIGDANTDTITISSEFSSSLIPSQDVTYDLGASGNAWRDLYLAGSTIYIGGGKLEYNDTLNQFELKNSSDAVVPVSLSANSTSDLSEGTNLYYTTARVLSDGTSIVPGGSLGGTVGDVTLQYRADGNYSGTPAQGSFYFDALNSRLKVYTGSSFIDAVPVSGGGGGATTNANATFSKYLYTIPSETNVVTGASDEVVGYTQLYIGKDFEIVTEGTTDFIAFGATTGTVGETFTVDSDGTSAIADLVLGKEYKIVTAGDTDFTVIGAADNNPDTVFTFNGVTTQSATTGTVIAEGNGTANPVLVYVVDDATSVEVYVNGIKQYEGATNDYVATTGSSVNFTYNLPVSALVDVQVYELLTNDAYYTKAETYSQAEVNTQISNALTIYDDQTASDARYVNIDGDTMTGNLVVDSATNFVSDLDPANKSLVVASTGATGGTGQYGASIAFSRVNTSAPRAAIAAVNTDSNFERMGLSFWTHIDNTPNVMYKRMQIDHTGDISFYDSSTNPKFFWDVSAESLGIGTTSPSTTLTVAGTGDAETGVTATHSRAGVGYTLLLNNTNNGANKGSGIKWQGGGFDTAAIIGRSDATAASADAPGYLTFHTSTNGSEDLAERMRIDSAGNVGIGTSPDANSKLHLLDDTSSLDDYTIHIESYTPAIVFQDISAAATDFAIQVNNSALMFQYGDAATGTQLASEAMRINSSGNVTINSSGTIPTGVLLGRQLVVGSATGSEIIAFREDTDVIVGDISGALLIGNSDIDGVEDHFVGMWGKVSSTNGSQDLHFAAGRSGYESDAPQMTLDSSGNLIIGNSTTEATKVTLNKTGFLGLSTLGSATDSTFTIDVRGNLSTDIVAGEFLGGYLLDAYDASAATGAGISKFNGMHFVAGGNFGPSTSDVDLVFATGLNGNATEKMRIDASGTTHIKQVKAYGSETAVLRVSTTPTGTNYTDGAFQNIVFGDETVTNSYLGQIAVVQENASASTEAHMRFYTNAGGGNSATEERMRIDGSGNLFVGSDALSDINTVYKSIINANNEIMGDPANPDWYMNLNAYYIAPGYKFRQDGYAVGMYHVGDGQLAIRHSTVSGLAGDAVTWDVSTIFDANGNLLINSSTPLTPISAALEIRNDQARQILMRNTNAVGGDYWGIGVDSSANNFVVYNDGGVGVYVQDGANSWTGTSDERLKNITGKIENAIDAVKTLTPAKFTWKDDEDQKPQVGLIAQEVEKVLPEVVGENSDGYLGVRYTETIPLLLAAIQEQQEQIEQLKAEVAALKGAN